MGEIRDMMEEGLLCEICGTFVGEHKIKKHGGKFEGNTIVKSPGFPLKCGACIREEIKDNRRKSAEINK